MNESAQKLSDMFTAALEEREGVTEALYRATDALIWVTGHGDFGDGGKYREGWLKVGQPALDRLLTLMDVPDDVAAEPVPTATEGE